MPGPESVSLSPRGRGPGVCYSTRAVREKVPQRASMQKRATKDTEIEGEGHLVADPAGRGPARVPG